MTDDHAQWALPCYGNSEIYAPNLDYLASTGVVMANAFTPTPVCSPARASFWTGLYPSQHGVHDYLAEHEADIGSRNWIAHKPNLGQLLQASGYKTAMCGKWHCGRGEGPIEGFDFWYSAWRQTPKYHLPTAKYSDQGKVIEKPGYDTQIITDAALSFLRQPKEQPFFLFIGFSTTHSPWLRRAERLVSRYRGSSFKDIPIEKFYPFGIPGDSPKAPSDPKEVAAQYYASVGQIDEMVGRVLDELDALGQREDTLLIYSSDHGLNLGQHQVWGKGNATRPLNMLEESIRVPLIINYPSCTKNATKQEAVNHTDLFMTLLDYADALPDDAVYPGETYKPLLGGQDQVWRDVHIGEYGPVRMIRSKTHKLIVREPLGPNLFFDLEQDPREMTNLYNEKTSQDNIFKLSERLSAFFNRFEDVEYSGLRNPLPKHNHAHAWDNGSEKGT